MTTENVLSSLMRLEDRLLHELEDGAAPGHHPRTLAPRQQVTPSTRGGGRGAGAAGVRRGLR